MMQLSEAVLLERFEQIGAVDPELASMLRKMVELPRGTPGREYFEFYMEQKFQSPGEGVSIPGFFVAHDMTHLIAGFGATGPEEVALSAMQLAMNDSEEHWMLFLTSVAAYEVGISSGITEFEAKDGILIREGAAELLFEGFERGSNCSGDFSIADHLSMVHLSISTIREMYSVPATSGNICKAVAALPTVATRLPASEWLDGQSPVWNDRSSDRRLSPLVPDRPKVHPEHRTKAKVRLKCGV